MARSGRYRTITPTLEDVISGTRTGTGEYVNYYIEDLVDFIAAQINSNSGNLVINGWFTKKKVGALTPDTHEVGDFVHGWDGTKFVAGRINALPFIGADELDLAIGGTIFE